MKNDFISVGPPQNFGDRIDRPLGLDPGLKGDFENLLQKGLDRKEQKVESALGGINREVPEDRNGFKEKTKEAERETKVKEPEKEKERKKIKTNATGVEMSASNTMVSIENSLEVGSLESDFENTNPEQNATEYNALAGIGVSTEATDEGIADSATAIANERPIVDPSALHPEDALATDAIAEVNVETSANLGLAPSKEQNLNPVNIDFEKSIQDQLARDQKEMTMAQPIEERTSDESRMDSFENLNQIGQEIATPNQNAVSSPELKTTGDFATLQAAPNLQNEFSEKSEQDSASQDQSTSDQSVANFDQQGDARQLHVHRDSDFRAQLGTAAAASSLGKESVGLSTADRTEIVKQAQVLVNDGGGMAKIQLQSEELGSIDLHVRLTNGKVQIEVGSNDPALKAAIEDSLSDLKSSLAQHNFDLDHVKIKGVSGASENFSMQSNHSNSGNQSNGMQTQSDASGSKNGFASQNGDERRHQSHRESQMRELGSMYRQSQAHKADRSNVIQPMNIGRGISRYQKSEVAATAGRSAWVA